MFDNPPCKDKTELFFTTNKHKQKEPIAICQTCPYKEPCALLGKTEMFGIWGGTTPRSRGYEVNRLTYNDWRECNFCKSLYMGALNKKYCSPDCHDKYHAEKRGYNITRKSVREWR